MWNPYENGTTIGTVGSEDGIIIKDEEFLGSARITLERDGNTPYVITCGIYGHLVHTTFFKDEGEAIETYEAMKQEIAGVMDKLNDDAFDFDDWSDNFIDKY